MGIFNPENFLDDEVGGPMSTERELIPADTYRNCYVKDVKVQEGIIGKGERAGKPWARLNLVWVIDDQALRDKLNRAEVTITQGLMLDLDDNDRLDTRKGRNVRLGRVRKALGLNEGSIKFKEFIGKTATLQIAHGVNSQDGSATEEVAAVAGQ